MLYVIVICVCVRLLAGKMMATMENEHHTMTGGVGSYLYMAPEVVRYEEYNEKAS